MKKNISILLSIIMILGLFASTPFTAFADEPAVPKLSDAPKINMVALADRDYTHAIVYYENSAEALEFGKELEKYGSDSDYLIDNYGFSDEEYKYHYIYVYVQTAYSLNGGSSWVNDFDRDDYKYDYMANDTVKVGETTVYLPTQSADLDSVYQSDTLFDLSFYDWEGTKKEAMDACAAYLTQDKASYINHDYYHYYEVNLNAANSLLVKSRYVVVVTGEKEGEEKKTYTEYSDWSDTFSFCSTTTPETEDFIRSGIYNGPTVEYLRKGGAYYYIGIMPDEELSKAIAQHRVIYSLGLTNDYYETYDAYYISWYIELKINDGDWFHYSTQGAGSLIYSNIHDSYLTENLESWYGITLQPEDRIYLRARLMTDYQTERTYLDNTENSDGRYIYVPDEVMTFVSDYSNEIEIPFSGRYRISYYMNGGSWPNYNSKIYDFGEDDTGSIDLTSEDYLPEKYGYTFGGWYTTEDFKEGTEITEIDFNEKKFVTVYAKWETEGEYDIKYELGISGAYHYNRTMYTPLMDDIELSEASYSGITFLGWYENENFTGEPITVIDTARKENITLYAKWELPTYNIIYELDGGTNNPENPATFQVNTEGGGDALLKAPTKTGYIFDGWYYDEDFDYSVSKYDDGWHFNGTKETTIYAKWILGRWDITYINILDGAKTDDYHPYNSNPSEYTFGDTVKLKDMSHSGYVFGGWYTDEACTKAATGIAATDEGEKTFYAKWTENVYTITYVFDSDKDNSPDVSTVTNTNPATRKYTQTIELVNAETTDGNFIFEGWHNDINMASDIVERVSGDNNITLYAKWTPKITYIPTWGDVTLSSKTNASDARLILRYSAQLETFDEMQIKLADINNDGKVNAMDARLVLRISAQVDNIDDLVAKYSLPTISVKNGEIVFT